VIAQFQSRFTHLKITKFSDDINYDVILKCTAVFDWFLRFSLIFCGCRLSVFFRVILKALFLLKQTSNEVRLWYKFQSS